MCKTHKGSLKISFQNLVCACSPLVLCVSYPIKNSYVNTTLRASPYPFSALIRVHHWKTVTQVDLLSLKLHSECFASGALLLGTNPPWLSPTIRKRTHRMENLFVLTQLEKPIGKNERELLEWLIAQQVLY